MELIGVLSDGGNINHSGDVHFFDANKRKVSINQGFLQMEGICAVSDTWFYISNERFSNIITVPAKLQTIDLAPLLNPYYSKQPIKPATGLIARNALKPKKMQTGSRF